MKKNTIPMKVLALFAYSILLSTTIQAKDLTIMSLNAYAFPKFSDEVLTAAKKLGIPKAVPLMPKTTQSPEARIKKMATFVSAQSPDIVAFQELWGKGNKETMIKALKKDYPHYYYNTKAKVKSMVITPAVKVKGLGTIIPAVTLPLGMESGLLIMSKIPMIKKEGLVYKVAGITGEKYANKGALFVTFKQANGKEFLVVNTHLQVGSGEAAEKIRAAQAKELATKMAPFRAMPIFLAGDLNSEIRYDEKTKRIVDNTHFAQAILSEKGVFMSAATLKGLIEAELRNNKPFRGSNTENTQLIDLILATHGTLFKDLKIFRKELLGKEDKGMNRDTALSDHAAVMATFNITV